MGINPSSGCRRISSGRSRTRPLPRSQQPETAPLAITLKKPTELAIMRDAGRIVAEVLLILREHVRPGVSTAELDEIALREARKRNAEPSFLGYHGFPGSICASVNDQVVHGIPSRRRILRPGDIVSVDFGVRYRGYQGDAAVTLAAGATGDAARRLLEGTEGALYAAIEQARPGNRL